MPRSLDGAKVIDGGPVGSLEVLVVSYIPLSGCCGNTSLVRRATAATTAIEACHVPRSSAWAPHSSAARPETILG